MNKIYIVGRCVDYGYDGIERNDIVAYTKKIDADTHAFFANQWVGENLVKDSKSQNIDIAVNPYDKECSAAWGNKPEYYVRELSLKEEFKEEPNDYYTYARYHFI